MISNELEMDRHRLALARDGRVQIRQFLQEEAAVRLRDCLAHEVPWATAEKGQPDARPEDASWRQMDETYSRATGGFHFSYDRYLIINAIKEGRDPGLLLHAVLEFFNGPQYLEFIRYLGGNPALNMVSAQATRYRPGQFLRLHDDNSAEEGRRFAYVLNLNPEWEADWGGLLQFVDESGRVQDSFVPSWNSLSLFRVPAKHHVGLVCPWAGASRLAITGWWHAKPA